MDVLSPRPVNLPMQPPPLPKAVKKPRPESRPKPEEKPTNPDRIDDKWRPPSTITEPGSNPETYSMGRKLGKGGFAVCFEGKSKRTSEVFALKVVKAKVEQKKMMEKFRTELQIHAKMHHPNIVEFLRAFTIEDHTYVVLQLCPNGSLTEMVKTRTCLSLPEVRRFMVQICGGVKYMHKRSVIHRDLKMGNIFLDGHMNIKIGDFGLAAVMADEQDRRTTLCGTPNYIAPEILSKSGTRGHDNKVDTWAIGVICYAMLMGTPPFQSKTQQEIYSKLRTLEYEWKVDSKNYIPPQAKDFVASCLNLNSAERPGMDELVQHKFFTMGVIAEELDTICLRTTPPWLENADPRGDRVLSGYGMSHGRLCRECGVGTGSDGRLRPGVGIGAGISTLVEIEAENREGCAPVVPLPAGVLYQQFSNAHAELSARQKQPLLVNRVRSRKPISDKAEVTDSLTNAPKPEVESMPVPVQKAPLTSASSAARPIPSFAAQQRQQALPSGAHRRTERPPVELPKSKALEVPEQLHQALLKERPLRAATIRATRSTTLRATVSHTSKTLPRSATVPDAIDGLAKQIEATLEKTESRRVKSGIPLSKPLGEIQSVRKTSCAVVEAASVPLRPDSSLSSSSGSLGALPIRALKPITGNDRVRSTGSAENQQAPAKASRHDSVSRSTSAARVSLPKHHSRIIASTEAATGVPNSSGVAVLDSLRTLHKALDARSFEETGRRPRSAYGTRKEREDSKYPRVEKWVDYSTRHGIAYILSDATVGMVLKSSEDNVLPSSCVVVRNASKHTLKRARGLEYQFVPQGQDARDVEFYEQSDYEADMKRVNVPARNFWLDLEKYQSQVAAANAIQASLSGSAAERMKEVALLDKFGKYMNKQMGGSDTTDRRLGGNSQHLVHFYQRVGNVGVWRFADGGLQFNFPDHTKLTLRPAESDDDESRFHVDCVYLVPTDAISLAHHGRITVEAMERRGTTSYPLDDILMDVLRRSEMEIIRTNEIKEKLSWIRAVLGCWIKEGGLGKMGEERLGWSGLQERRDDKRIKLQWVTVGRFGGDGEGAGKGDA
ncbi:Cell cycle serine/threonine-protein kinase cdc5/MSD2 [Exophiala xenobiotica]|nr:Cell cycle serine/threonine-protein kinase cdc5/MSD2 [Exophiala xenobiotica]KAK5230222.1 Cell cycle serine/threonine-protein kinase cdc5/MSD2 [Exophiala xenobiotica]KAK5299369.1 Cell cycle serine/threonine-protein kinase cdc5/MSD2 [Exophiala xenobiotica]KAK5499792.1 Cell cycle serine/threonine-protein kinase cdc5/MSD2 [Exophiala xenobiotica]